MPNFGFKAKHNTEAQTMAQDDSMPNFGFKAKLLFL